MINKIKEGIANAIYKEFGEGYEIYTEEVEQGFLKPCFFIQTIRTGYQLLINNRYKMDNAFCVHFFPADEEEEIAEMDKASVKLVSALEFIKIDEKLKQGINKYTEYGDKALHFFVEFNLLLIRKMEDGALMEEYSLDIRT